MKIPRPLFLLVVVLMLAAPGWAQFSDLPPVPGFLPPAQVQDFEARRTDLTRRMKAWQRAYADFRAQFDGVKADTPQATAALARKAELKREADDIVDAIDAFTGNLNTAVAAARPARGPALSPAFFAMAGEAEFCRSQLEALDRRKKFLTAERDSLLALRDGLTELVVENYTASRDLMQDAESQSVVVLGGLLAMSGVPAPWAARLGRALAALHAGYLTYAAATTDEERRRQEKAVDAMAELKNFASSASNLPTGEEGERTRLVTDAALKLFKIYDRHRSPEGGAGRIRADLEDVFGASQDFIQAVDQRLGGTLKAGTGYPMMALSAYALSRLEADRAELDRAINSNGTALEYYNRRLAELDQRRDFYRERISRVRGAN